MLISNCFSAATYLSREWSYGRFSLQRLLPQWFLFSARKVSRCPVVSLSLCKSTYFGSNLVGPLFCTSLTYSKIHWKVFLLLSELSAGNILVAGPPRSPQTHSTYAKQYPDSVDRSRILLYFSNVYEYYARKTLKPAKSYTWRFGGGGWGVFPSRFDSNFVMHVQVHYIFH